jgi:hypothetical protein
VLGLVSVFLFAGYTLVYAAVANGGKFAAQPWESLRRDAYSGGGGSSSQGAASAPPSSHSSTWDTIRGIAGNAIGQLLK